MNKSTAVKCYVLVQPLQDHRLIKKVKIRSRTSELCCCIWIGFLRAGRQCCHMSSKPPCEHVCERYLYICLIPQTLIFLHTPSPMTSAGSDAQLRQQNVMKPHQIMCIYSLQQYYMQSYKCVGLAKFEGLCQEHCLTFQSNSLCPFAGGSPPCYSSPSRSECHEPSLVPSCSFYSWAAEM